MKTTTPPRTPTSPERDLTSEKIIFDYCENHGLKTRGVLIAFAPAVYILYRLDGIRGCAEHFSKALSTTITRRQVEGVLLKIRSGSIKVTPDELLAAAKAHPRAHAYFQNFPDALNPVSQ